MNIRKFIIKKLNNASGNLIRLIDIKDNKDLWFQCLHSYSIFYKSPIQVMNNPFIVERLMPHDACIIGVVCGDQYKKYLKNKTPIDIHHPLPIRVNNPGYYKLISLDRNGYVDYEDHNDKQYTTKILDLAQNNVDYFMRQHQCCQHESDAEPLQFIKIFILFHLNSLLSRCNQSHCFTTI